MTKLQIVTFWLMLTFSGVVLMAAAKCFGFASLEISSSGLKFFGGTENIETKIDTNNKRFTIVEPVNNSYKTTHDLENKSGYDWVKARCQQSDEQAISGLCVIDHEDGWGWVLQNAGITSPTEWGCAYRRGVYVEGENGTPGKKFSIIPPLNPPNTSKGVADWNDWRPKIEADVRAAAPTASATATVLCVKKVEPVKEDCSCWKRLFN